MGGRAAEDVDSHRSYTGQGTPDPDNLQIDQTDANDIRRSVFYEIKPKEEPLKPEAIALVSKRQCSSPTRCACPGRTQLHDGSCIQDRPNAAITHPAPETPDPPRQIHLDGRGLPKDPDPTWLGSSVGKWEGDTLVVQTTGFKEEGWLDNVGHPRSESMLITERFHRRDFGHIDLEIRYEDPKYYTRPFTNKITLHLLPDSDIIEYVCTENEKDIPLVCSAGVPGASRYSRSMMA